MAGYGMKTKKPRKNKAAKKMHKGMNSEARKFQRRAGSTSNKNDRIEATNERRKARAIKKGDVTTTTKKVVDKPATSTVTKGTPASSTTKSVKTYTPSNAETKDKRYPKGKGGDAGLNAALAKGRAEQKTSVKWTNPRTGKTLDYQAGTEGTKMVVTKKAGTPDTVKKTPATYKDKTTITPNIKMKVAKRKPPKTGDSGVATNVNTKTVRTTATGYNVRQKRKAQRRMSN